MADPLKITNFLGTMPKISPELLPANGAQIATNCKLYSGDLIPYPSPVVTDSTERGSATTKTLYALRNPSTGALRWLSWTTNVDIVSLPDVVTDDQRFYYTGDGVPKVSNYTLATTGSEPFPVASYDLGLPLPTTKVTATKSAYAEKTITTISRDSSNIVTVTTSANHNLRTGNVVNITGYGELAGTYSQASNIITVTITNHGLTTGDIVDINITSGGATSNAYTINVVDANTFTAYTFDSGVEVGSCSISGVDLNATGVTITKTGNTTFTYFSTGPTVTSTATTGRVNLAGSQELRTYVYTWITPWDEESIASDPSAEVYIIEGEEATITNLPTAKPTGSNFVRGVNLYRTISTTSGAQYFKLNTLWFPTRVVTVSRTSNVSTVTTEFPHNLYVGARFRITGSTPTGGAPAGDFNIANGVVTAITSDYVFSYAQTAADRTSQDDSGATMFHDVSQTPGTSTAQYWGDGSYTFTDNFDYSLLLTPLITDEYDAPPANLQGLKLFNNGMLVGFVGKTLYISEPRKPYAWPIKYSRTVEHNIVGLETLSGRLLVMTDAWPYIVDGSTPDTLSFIRMDVLYPCLNSRSIVNMGYGVVYSTNDGLAVYSGGGLALATKQVHSQDTWYTAVDPASVRAVFYGDAYFASYEKNAVSKGLILQLEDKNTFFVDTTYAFSAAWYDSLTGRLYYTQAGDSTIYEWDSLLQPAATMEWKSKVYKTPDFTNYGAARVVADYTNLTSTWDSTLTLWENTTQLWNNADQITFKLWADKALIFTTTLNDSGTFRLPTGYRTDTFEFSVAGNVRVRAVHMGTTPTSLMRV